MVKGHAADLGAGGEKARAREDAAVSQDARPQTPHERAEIEVALENKAHCRRLGLVDQQLAILDAVAERHHSTHPDALLLGGGDLVPDALAGDLALELGERQQHVSVSRPMLVVVLKLGDGVTLSDETNTLAAFEKLDQLSEVGKRAGEAVDFVDDHNVDAPERDFGQQAL